MRRLLYLSITALFAGTLHPAEPAKAPALPLPAPTVPENPPFYPMVVTAGGQKRLLADTEVTVSLVDGRPVVSHPDWWVINYPLTRIAGTSGKSEDEIAIELFGKPRAAVKNYYFRTPGETPEEPPAATGPAPIEPSAEPTIVVDFAGEGDHTTIADAVAAAQAGDVIQVRPGIYREAIVATTAGTEEKPIILEGLPDENGALPTISGNVLAPENAWTTVEGYHGVWRAQNWVEKPSELALDGSVMRERTIVSELEPGEFSHNYAAPELAFPQRDGDLTIDDAWADRSTDAEGYLDLGEKRGVFYLSSWLWIEPGERKEVWDPRFPEPLTGEVSLDGRFRAARQTGSGLGSQLNLYRFWVNGALLPAVGRAGEPKANPGYGQGGDSWQRFPMREGWNHLVILLDSRHRADEAHRIRLHLPKGTDTGISRSTPPEDLSVAGAEDGASFVTRWSVLGPIEAAERETAVYLRLPEGENPNDRVIDAGSIEKVLSLEAPHWTVRGLEFVHGAQYQQRTLVGIEAPGVTFEHNLLRETEVRTLSVSLSKWDQTAPPAIIRGNWMVTPGSLGVGATGLSDALTAENQNTDAPKRGRMLVEHNIILGNNRNGYKRFWESGGMKFFRLTNCVVRHNRIVGGDGPALWLDWEHYANRIEANEMDGATGFGIGIEASPGPTLIANNLVRNIEPGGAWFQYGLLAWSSARTWAVSNTLDTPNGAMFAEGGDDRNTVWRALPEREAVLANNFIVGRPVSIHRGRIGWAAGNRLYGPGDSGINRYSKWNHDRAREMVEASEQLGGETPPDNILTEEGVASLEIRTDGQTIDVVPLVRHDFNGLLRFPEDPPTVGAHRRPSESTVEIEWADGSIERQ